MRRRSLMGLALCIGVSATGASAQNTFPPSGNVGIGTTGPLSALTLAGTNTTNPNTGAEVDYSGENLSFENLGVAEAIGDIKMVQPNGYYIDAGDMVFSTSYGGLVEKMRITSLGNIGIGIKSPSAPLHIAKSAAANTNILMQTWDPINPNYALTLSNFNSSVGIDYRFTQFNGGGGYPILTFSASNVGIGTTAPGAKLEVDGDVKLTSGSGASMTFADGTSQATAWTGVLCGGDYAESVDVAGGRAQYGPGDVMVVDTSTTGGFAKSSSPYSTLVAGIYSTRPGVIGRRSTDPDKAKEEIPMAMIGIVPVKVSTENGPVSPGDLLVTSSMPGYAMKGTDHERLTGAVLGKALGSVTANTGTMEVLVSLQ